MTNLVALRAWTVTLPLRHALRHATADLPALVSVVTEVELASGVRGHAEVRGNGEYATGETVELVEHALAEVDVVDRRPADVVAELSQSSVLACMAVDVAVWDATARERELSLARAWNADARPLQRVRTHAQIGFGDIAPCVTLARQYVDMGFDRLKIRVGGDPAHDVARVRAIRAEVGDSCSLVIDANGGWSRDDAVTAVAALSDQEIAWVEQPVATIDDLQHVRDLYALPVFADESARGPESVRSLVGRVDGVHVKLEKCGTVRRLLETVESARAHGLRVALGQMDQGRLGCAVTTQLAVALGLERAELWGWAAVERDLTDVPLLDAGAVVVPDGVGNGVETIDLSNAKEIR